MSHKFETGFIFGFLVATLLAVIVVFFIVQTIDSHAALQYLQTVNPKLIHVVETVVTPYEPTLYERFTAWWNS